MSAAHTPGPWRVSEQCAQMIDIRHDNNEPGAISLTLAKVVARPSWQREAEANARLIAAAPELLEALQAVFRANQELREALRDATEALVDKDNRVRHWGEVFNASLPSGMQARAAIAKATGSAA